MIYLSKKWRRQPSVPIEVAPEWLPYFLFAHNFGFGRYGQEVVKKMPCMVLSKTGAVGQSALPSDRGPITAISGLSDSIYMSGTGTTSVTIPAGRCFLFAYCAPASPSQTLSCRSSASGNPICSLSVGSNGSSTFANEFVPIVRDDAASLGQHGGAGGEKNVADGQYHLLVLQRTTSVWQLSVDGATPTDLNSTPTAAQGAITFTADRIGYGSDIVNGTIGGDPKIAIAGLVIGLDATAFVKDMWSNPWMFFRPVKRRLYVNTAAAATGGPFPHYTRRKLTGGMPIGVM